MKKFVTMAVLLCMAGFAYAGIITTLLYNTSTIGPGPAVNFARMSPDIPHANHSFQATLSGASAVSAVVAIEASNDDSNWLSLATLTIPASGTGPSTVGSQVVSTYAYMRGNLVGISGAGATVFLITAE